MRGPALLKYGHLGANRRLLNDPSAHRVSRCCAHTGFLGLQFIYEGFQWSKLLSQLTKMGFQGIELFVQVIQRLGERLDPGKS